MVVCCSYPQFLLSLPFVSFHLLKFLSAREALKILSWKLFGFFFFCSVALLPAALWVVSKYEDGGERKVPPPTILAGTWSRVNREGKKGMSRGRQSRIFAGVEMSGEWLGGCSKEVERGSRPWDDKEASLRSSRIFGPA
jgi:hypothetical protein